MVIEEKLQLKVYEKHTVTSSTQNKSESLEISSQSNDSYRSEQRDISSIRFIWFIRSSKAWILCCI